MAKTVAIQETQVQKAIEELRVHYGDKELSKILKQLRCEQNVDLRSNGNASTYNDRILTAANRVRRRTQAS